jgi:hypothetical protein
MAGPFVKIDDIFSFRVGTLLQIWAVGAQDAIPKSNGDAGGFVNQIYMRRARFYLAGTAGPDLTYTVLIESGNLGQVNATGTDKNYTVPMVTTPGTNPVTLGIYEAYLSYKLNPNLSIQAGSMLLPFARNILQSAGTFLTIDVAGVSAQHLGFTQTNILREIGAQLKINAVDNHFELRAMVSQGVKLPDTDDPVAGVNRTAGKNTPRLTGFLQYNFLDSDSGYVFNGQYFGKKRILAAAVGGDYQQLDTTGEKDNPYFATSATLFAAIPLKGANPKGGDEVVGQVAYYHYHGGGGPPASGLGKRDGFLGELSYYNKAAKLAVFGQYQGLFFDGAKFPSTGDTRSYAGGLKYFFAEQIFNLTLQYTQTQFPFAPKDAAEAAAQTPALPPSAARNSTNLIQLQLQLAI